MAEEVESKRLVTPAEALGTREEQLLGDAPPAVAEQVLALVTPDEAIAAAGAARVAIGPAARRRARPALRTSRPASRRAARSAQRLEELRRLGTLLGSPLIEVEGDDVVEAAARVAAERGTTYVIIGQPPPRRGAAALHASRSPTASCAGCRAWTSGSSRTGASRD